MGTTIPTAVDGKRPALADIGGTNKYFCAGGVESFEEQPAMITDDDTDFDYTAISSSRQ